MNLSYRFVTLMLPKPYRRVGGVVVGTVVTLVWMALLGIQTYGTALFALSIVAMFECVRFAKEHPMEKIVIDTAVGSAYAVFIASASTTPHSLTTAIAVLIAVSAYGYLLTRPPASLRWITQRLPHGLGTVVANVIGGTASGLISALCIHLVQRWMA